MLVPLEPPKRDVTFAMSDEERSGLFDKMNPLLDYASNNMYQFVKDLKETLPYAKRALDGYKKAKVYGSKIGGAWAEVGKYIPDLEKSILLAESLIRQYKVN